MAMLNGLFTGPSKRRNVYIYSVVAWGGPMFVCIQIVDDRSYLPWLPMVDLVVSSLLGLLWGHGMIKFFLEPHWAKKGLDADKG